MVLDGLPGEHSRMAYERARKLGGDGRLFCGVNKGDRATGKHIKRER